MPRKSLQRGIVQEGRCGHLHYQRSKAKVNCINCHLHVGHYRGKRLQEPEDLAEAAERELDKTFPIKPQGFQNYTEEIPGSDAKFKMVAVSGGTFLMGSPPTGSYQGPDEGPVRKVKLSPFWMGEWKSLGANTRRIPCSGAREEEAGMR